MPPTDPTGLNEQPDQGPEVFQDRLRRLAGNQYTGADFRAEEHALAASRWLVMHRLLTVSAAVLAGVAGSAVLAGVAGAGQVLVGVVALISAVAAAADNALGAAQVAAQHKNAMDGFTSLRTKWLRLRELTVAQNDETAATARFDELLAERDEISANAPAVPTWTKARVERRRAS